MSTYIANENKMVTCPYDNSHRMKQSTLQYHIVGCKMNHLNKRKKVCPFNATHLLPSGEYDHHLITCPDRAPLDRQLANSVDKNNPFKGRTDVPPFSDPIPLDDEVWDVDTHTVQLNGPPPGAVLEPGEFQKPSERKRFYQELHRIPRGSEGATIISPPVPAPVKPPRQPTTHSIIEDSNKSNAHLQKLGLGRGKPASRIAANFHEAPATISYSAIVSDMGNLGLGRGKASKKEPSIFDDDEDFPALDCGRGIAPKQNVRNPGAKPKKR